MGRQKTPVGQYLTRFNHVIDYIEAHLSGDLQLSILAAEANFSPFHFHRLFSEWYGETPQNYVSRRRIETGASLLRYSGDSIAAIAHQCGFESTDGFARAFKLYFAMSPLKWRSEGYEAWQSRISPPPPIPYDLKHWEVTIETLPSRQVTYCRRVSPYAVSSGEQWQYIAQWMEQNQIHNATRFGMGLDNPAIIMPSKCRYDVCVELPPDFPIPPRLPIKTIVGGRYAILKYRGPPTESGSAWRWLYQVWLPQSGYHADARPSFERYLPDIPNPSVPAQDCDLCMGITLQTQP